jgi:hypothetical protein
MVVLALQRATIGLLRAPELILGDPGFRDLVG